MSDNLKAFFEKKNAEMEGTEHILQLQSSDHRRLLLTQLAELRHDSQLCDVILVAKDTRIHAHRVVLAASSCYFKAMFTHEMAEKEVEIKDMEGSTLHTLVNFCYSGRITINLINVLSILPACCLLQLDEVQEYCCEFLRKQLHPLNCLGIRAFADTYACRELLRYSYQYILDHFQEVADTEEFLLLPAEQVIELISNEKLRVVSEEKVFEAIIEWVTFDLTARKQFFPQLLQQVRLPLCYPKFLVDTVSEVDLVMEDINCRRLLEEAKNYQLLLSTPVRPDMQGPRTRPRNPIKYSEVLYLPLIHEERRGSVEELSEVTLVLLESFVSSGSGGASKGWLNGLVIFVPFPTCITSVGGLRDGAALDSVERLDPGEPNPSWQPVASMTRRRGGLGVAVLGNLLYAVGGRNEGEILSSVERYDPTTNQWSNDVAPMLTRRGDFGLTTFDGILCAVGGYDGLNYMDSVECYDARRNQWISVAAMGSCRRKLAVSVLNSCLYAVGGFDGTCLNIVERLDPRVGKWQVVRPMSTPRCSPGTAVLDGNLYAAGGYDGSLELSSVEKYDPLTNEWTEVAAMNCKRYAVGLAVVNERMYAVGGDDGECTQNTVEVFDPEASRWTLHSSMEDGRSSAGVGVIPMP